MINFKSIQTKILHFGLLTLVFTFFFSTRKSYAYNSPPQSPARVVRVVNPSTDHNYTNRGVSLTDKATSTRPTTEAPAEKAYARLEQRREQALDNWLNRVLETPAQVMTGENLPKTYLASTVPGPRPPLRSISLFSIKRTPRYITRKLDRLGQPPAFYDFLVTALDKSPRQEFLFVQKEVGDETIKLFQPLVLLTQAQLRELDSIYSVPNSG